jgi:hypothetical protein
MSKLLCVLIDMTDTHGFWFWIQAMGFESNRWLSAYFLDWTLLNQALGMDVPAGALSFGA